MALSFKGLKLCHVVPEPPGHDEKPRTFWWPQGSYSFKSRTGVQADSLWLKTPLRVVRGVSGEVHT